MKHLDSAFELCSENIAENALLIPFKKLLIKNHRAI